MTGSLPRTPTRRLAVYAWPLGAAAVVGGAFIILFASPPGADPPPGWSPSDAASQTTASPPPDAAAGPATPTIPSVNETPGLRDVAGVRVPG